MSSISLSPGFFDPRNYSDDRRENEETLEVVVPQNTMEESPNALTAMIAWWFASSPGCKCGGERRGITKIYTY